MCCQEVTDAAGLATASGYSYYTWTAGTGSTWGNMIMSYYPLTNVSTKVLTETAYSGTRRNAIFATIKDRVFVCTHLNGGDIAAANNERILHINEINAEITDAVICGDFNHITGRTSYDHALTLWDDAGGVGNTTAADKRDFIYTLNEVSSNPVITDNLTASDHKPLEANIN